MVFLEEAALIFQSLGFLDKKASILNNLGQLYRSLSEYESSLEKLEEAHKLFRLIAPDSRSAAINLQELALTYASLNKFDQAKRLNQEALDIATELEDTLIEVVSMVNMAEFHLKAHELKEAEQLYKQARALSENHGLKMGEVHALQGLGNVFFAKSFFTKAKLYHLEAYDLAETIGDKSSVLSCLLLLTQDELSQQAHNEAINYANKALLLAEETEQLRPLYESHELLAKAHKALTQFDKAVYHLEAYHRIERQIFNDQNSDKTRRLTIKFDLEKANHEAEMYRLKSQLEEEAHSEAKRLVKERTQDLENAQIEIVNRLAVAAEFRDDDTGVHTLRVGRTAALIAYVLNWPLEDVQLLYTAARLHDVGKIGISDTILLKPGKFTNEEFAVMKEHTRIGARILEKGHSPLLKLAEEIALSHHERWDGRGYPMQIKGNDIPLAARIVSVADVLDALTSERPYKKAWPLEDTLAEIKRNSGSQFDPQIVDVCLLLFGSDKYFSPQDVAMTWEELTLELDSISHLREENTKTSKVLSNS